MALGMQPTTEFRAIKAAILSMLDESDALDYAVIHTVPKSTAVVRVSRCLARPNTEPLFRINITCVEKFAVVNAYKGNGYEKILTNRYVQNDDEAARNALLAAVTELIDNADNQSRISQVA